jgi:cysteine desulfurase
VHQVGQIARQHLESARRTIAARLNAPPAELIFTSGGTESNNLAIFGLVRAIDAPRKHAITTTIEHPSVMECFRQLEREGVAVTYVGVNGAGLIQIAELEQNLREDTILVSVMHANNETGVIQPLKEVSSFVQKRRLCGQQIYLHSDGVQTFGKIQLDLSELGVDFYSVSAHKIYGPKGIGALFARKDVPLRPLYYGGRQERGRRAGTENVPGAIGFACAAELCSEADIQHYVELRNRFEAQVLSVLDGVEVNGTADRLPNTSNLLFRGCSAEALLIALDLKGMCVSTGSACSSGSVEPSPALLAMGRTREEARSSIRFSFGRYNTREEIDALSDTVIASVRRLRNRSSKEKHLVAR